MELVRKARRSVKLFTSVDTTAFASILVILILIILVVASMSSNRHHAVSVDLPHVSHPASMPGALREDAMQITILRDGQVYLRQRQNLVGRPGAEDSESVEGSGGGTKGLCRRRYAGAVGRREVWRWTRCAPPGLSELHFWSISAGFPSSHNSRRWIRPNRRAEAAVPTPVCPLRISRPVLDPDRRSYKSEGLADLVFEKALVGKVQLDGAVGEQHERGRRDRSLRHV